MTLKVEVTTRVSNQLLVELTNQGTTGTSTINDPVIDAAVADAEGEFFEEVGRTLDLTEKADVAAGVCGVLHYLHSYKGLETENAGNLRRRWERWLAKLAVTSGAERRILPTTSSVLLPSEETRDARPDFDRARWERLVPDMPGGGDDKLGRGL